MKRTQRTLKVIVVRQPWAWLIVNGFKDIENRSWATRYRGPLLIQASASLPSKADFEQTRRFVERRGVKLPERFETGGVVGMVQLDDCVGRSRSKWFEGPVGWVLSKPNRVRFVPMKGRLGLFDAPKEVRDKLRPDRSLGRSPSQVGDPRHIRESRSPNADSAHFG